MGRRIQDPRLFAQPVFRGSGNRRRVPLHLGPPLRDKVPGQSVAPARPAAQPLGQALHRFGSTARRRWSRTARLRGQPARYSAHGRYAGAERTGLGPTLSRFKLGLSGRGFSGLVQPHPRCRWQDPAASDRPRRRIVHPSVCGGRHRCRVADGCPGRKNPRSSRPAPQPRIGNTRRLNGSPGCPRVGPRTNPDAVGGPKQSVGSLRHRGIGVPPAEDAPSRSAIGALRLAHALVVADTRRAALPVLGVRLP